MRKSYRLDLFVRICCSFAKITHQQTQVHIFYTHIFLDLSYMCMYMCLFATLLKIFAHMFSASSVDLTSDKFQIRIKKKITPNREVVVGSGNRAECKSSDSADIIHSNYQQKCRRTIS